MDTGLAERAEIMENVSVCCGQGCDARASNKDALSFGTWMDTGMKDPQQALVSGR